MGINHRFLGRVGAGYADHQYGIPMRFFHGTMDEVRIYRAALSEGEILQLWHFREGRIGWLDDVTATAVDQLEGLPLDAETHAELRLHPLDGELARPQAAR